MNGIIFNDGEAVDLNSNEHGHLINKLAGNPHFEFDAGDDDGDPSLDDSKRNLKEGIDRARDYSFERDQRSEQAERDARALAATPRKPGRPSNAEKAAKAQEAADEQRRADEAKEAEDKAERDRAEAEKRRQEEANKPSPLPNVNPVQ